MVSLTGALSPAEIDIVRRSLKATVEGSFFLDWEFQTLMGVDRDAVRTVYEAWPQQTIPTDDFVCAVQNSLGNLLVYPHAADDELMTYVPEGFDAIRAVLERLVEQFRAEK